MTPIPVGPNVAGTAVVDPLVDLQNLSDPRRVPHELPHYLMKLLLARLPENRKVELSLHLYPKALELMAQNNLTTGNNNLKLKLLVPFSSCLFKYRAHFFGMSGVVKTKKVTLQVVVEDPLLNPYKINQPVNCFYLLKLLLARLPISDRSKVTNPLLVLAIFYMHQHNLWTELLPFNPIWSPMMKRSTGVKLHDSKSTIPVSSAATPIKNITPPVNVPAKTGVITTTPVSEKQKPSPPGSSLKECYGNLPYSKPKEAPFTPLKKYDWCAPPMVPVAPTPSTFPPMCQQSIQRYNSGDAMLAPFTPLKEYDWCAPPMVPVAPTPTFPPMCQQSIQRYNSGHAMLASFTPLKEDDWCVPPMVFVPPTSSTFPPMSQQSIQRNNSGNAKVAPFTPLIEYDWCAPPMVPFAPSTSLPRSQQSKQDSKATVPVSRATPIKNAANVPAKTDAIITTSISEKPKSLSSDASNKVCKKELPNPKAKEPTPLRQPAGDLTNFDWSAPCSPPQSKQSNQPYNFGHVSLAATSTAVTDGPIDWSAPPSVEDSAISVAPIKNAIPPVNVSAKTGTTTTTSVSEKPKLPQDKFAGFDWGSLPTVPAAPAPSTSTQSQHSNQHYNSCNANALSLAITSTIPVSEKPKPNPIDASLEDGKLSHSNANEEPFTPLKREEFADFDWCSPPTVPAATTSFPPQSQQSKQDLKATVPVCSVPPVKNYTQLANVPVTTGVTTILASEKPKVHSIDASIKVCKGEMLHSKAIEAATHTAGDFSGFDWSARSPTSPPPSTKVPTPSTSSTQSQQLNQRYKGGNDNAPSSTISFTSVTDGPIDWSAPPRVDDSEDKASTKLRPSFQIVPECVDAVYDDERSQQDLIILKSQEEVLKDPEVDPFASHKTFCLLCATSEHSMVDCPETPPSKMVRIVDLKLCAKCLSPGHLASDCTELVVCATCGLDHFEYIYHWFQIVELTKKLDSEVPAICAAPVKNTTPSANVSAVTSAFTIPVFEKPKPKPDESKAAGHFCLPKTDFDWSAPASFPPPSPTVQTPSAPTTSPPQSQQLNQRNNSDNGNASFSAAEASTGKDKDIVKNVEVDPFASHKTFCLLCATSEHSMVDCPETPPAKMVRIGELKLCSKCLSPGHLASDCTELVVCATCALDHFDYIYHKPTGDWTLKSTWKQISVSSEQIVSLRERPMSQVSNVSAHLDMANGGDDVHLSKRHFHDSVPGNSSYADLEDLLCLTDRSDTTIPIQLIPTPQLLISFD